MNDTQQYERASRRVLMSKLIKIYDGMTFSLSTGEVLEKGEVSYWHEEDINLCSSGSGTSKSVSGFGDEYKDDIKDVIKESKDLYDEGDLGKVAAKNADYDKAIQAGRGTADDQFTLEKGMTAEGMDRSGLNALESRTGMTSSEQAMIDQAGKPVDLSGMRAGALQQAQGALNTSQGMAGARGGLGGSRQALNQASITNDLAGKFAGIDQQAQQMQMQQLNAAVGAEQGQFGRLGSAMQGQQAHMGNMGTALGATGQYAGTLGQVGQAQMGYDQQQADSKYNALAQRVGLFSSIAPRESITTKMGGK